MEYVRGIVMEFDPLASVYQSLPCLTLGWLWEGEHVAEYGRRLGKDLAVYMEIDVIRRA